jgi:hypothetical protein
MTVRFMGGLLVLVGVLVFATAVVVGLLDLPIVVLSATVAVAMVVVLAAALALARVAVIVRLDEIGFRVRYLRRAGVKQGRWVDVEDVATGFASEQPVVVLRHRDGRTTTIPVNLLAGSSDDFVRDLRSHLDGSQGIRRKR